MKTQLPKPDVEIPDDEWQALSASEQAYAEFIYEVFDYFDVVVRDKLKWQPETIKVSQGKNNIVIGFDQAGERYLFRVPKYGQSQLQNYMRASRLVGHYDFFPKRIYIDGQCMIERFALGSHLDVDAATPTYVKLAHCLNQLHAQAGEGYGQLLVGNKGVAQDIVEHYFARADKGWQRLMSAFQEQIEVFRTLRSQWQEKLYAVDTPPVLCHGDLWSNNVIYDEASEQLSIIDWESCGIYHREKDLHFLLNDAVAAHHKQAFFEHYVYPVDPQLMSWYRLTMNVLYFDDRRLEHLINSANHFLVIMGCSVQLDEKLAQQYFEAKDKQ